MGEKFGWFRDSLGAAVDVEKGVCGIENLWVSLWDYGERDSLVEGEDADEKGEAAAISWE